MEPNLGLRAPDLVQKNSVVPRDIVGGPVVAVQASEVEEGEIMENNVGGEELYGVYGAASM